LINNKQNLFISLKEKIDKLMSRYIYRQENEWLSIALLIHGLSIYVNFTYHLLELIFSNTTYWRPSDKLQKSLTFTLGRGLRLVSMRSPLLPQPAKWVVRNNDTTYSLQTSFQINLTTNPHNPVKIAICNEYK